MTDQADDSIEPGKRLVRARGLGGVSLGERIANQFYRLTWRTPLHKLRLKGRYPLKLLVAPVDPLPGNRTRGESLMEGTLARWNHACSTAECDFGDGSPSALFRDYAQSFGWLRDLAVLDKPRETGVVAEGLMRQWVARYGEKLTDTAWAPELWGMRILNWSLNARLILQSNDLVYRSTVLNTMARGARHLDRSADRAQIGMPRVTAWSGVIAAGLLMPGGEPRRVVGEAGLERALKAAMLPDGGSACRSPQNLMDIIATLSMLESVYEARRIAFPAFIDDTVERGIPALLAVLAGDGGLGSWQGSSAIAASDVDAVVKASRVRARPMRQARDWGYQRISAGNTHIVMDAAPPPVSRVAMSGCASTLAFEVSDGTDRLIVNCGGARASGLVIPATLAAGLRTTAAHSTLILADANSTAVHADGQLGKGVEEIEVDREETDALSKIIASHDGYEKRLGLVHRRSLAVSNDGREIRCDDVLLPGNARRKPTQSSFAIRLHLGPAVEASPTADGAGALLRIDEGPLWQFKAKGGAVAVDDSLWVDGDGALYNTQQVVISGEAPPGGASISWVLKRAG